MAEMGSGLRRKDEDGRIALKSSVCIAAAMPLSVSI